MLRIDKPGIYRGVESADYFADPCVEPSLSQSICKVLIERSPLRAKHEHPRLQPPVADGEEDEKYIKAQAIGNAAHALMIGRGKTLEAITFNDFKKGDARELRDALKGGRLDARDLRALPDLAGYARAVLWAVSSARR